MYKQIAAIIFLFGFLGLSAQTADEIIKQHFEAKGGKKAVNNIETIYIDLNSDNPTQGKAEIEYYYKEPGMMRIKSIMNGQTNVIGTNGETAWQIPPYQGATAQQIPAQQLPALNQQLSIFKNIIIGIDPDNLEYFDMKYDGLVEEENKSLHKVVISDTSANTQDVYFDSVTYLMDKIVAQQPGQMGQTTEIIQEVESRGKADGIFYPEVMKIYANGQLVQTFTLNKVEINKDMSDSLFEMPRKEPNNEDSQK